MKKAALLCLLALVLALTAVLPAFAESDGLPETEPITDANAEFFLGTWYLVSMDMGGVSFSAADFGLEMSLEFDANGYAAIVMDEEPDYTAWRMENGEAFVIVDSDTYSPVTVLEDGTIAIGDENESMIFSREGSGEREDITDPAAADFVGSWYDERSERYMTLSLNGVVIMTAGDETSQTTWDCQDGKASLNLGVGSSVPMELRDGDLYILADNIILSFAPFTGELPVTGIEDVQLNTYDEDDGGVLGADDDEEDGGVLGADEDDEEDGGVLGADDDEEVGGVLSDDDDEDEVGGVLGGDSDEDEEDDDIEVGGVLGGDSDEDAEDDDDDIEVGGVLGGDSDEEDDDDAGVLGGDSDFDDADEDEEEWNTDALDETAEAFLGTWTAEDGMTLVLSKSGKAVLTADGETAATTWECKSGAATLAIGKGSVTMMLYMKQLLVYADNGVLIFNAPVEEVQPTEKPVISTELDERFVGTWYCIWTHTGMGGVDPRVAYYGNWYLTLNADGTGALTIGDPEPGTWYKDEEGVTYYDETPMVIRPDGRLQQGSELSGALVFSKNEKDVWDPEKDELVSIGKIVMEEISQQAADNNVQNGASTEAPADIADRMGVKFVATGFTSGGISFGADMLGAEYAIIFKKGGDANFTIAGFACDLKWTSDEKGMHVDYFGTDMLFVPTETGFTLDYMGAMDIIFGLPAAE